MFWTLELASYLEDAPWPEQESSWSSEQISDGRAVAQTELADKGLMDYPPVPLTRGQFLKKWGSLVVLLPVISSMAVPEPAAAASGVSCTCLFISPANFNAECATCGGDVGVSAGGGTNCSNVADCNAQCAGAGKTFTGYARNAGGFLVCCCG